MDTYENDNIPQEGPGQVPQEPRQMPQAGGQQTAQGYAGSAFNSRKESPFANSPYVTYHSFQPQDSYQQSYQTAYQAPPAAKKGGKVWKRMLAGIAAVALVAAGCGVTALLVNGHWRNQNGLLRRNFEEKLQILQSQIDENKGSGGSLTVPGNTLTAGQIYEQNLASVVAIRCTIRENSFGQIIKATSAGSGFVMTAQGHIVTNYHVVEGASEIEAVAADGTQWQAKLIGFDQSNDIALLKVEAEGLRPVVIGSSDGMQVGDQVVAIGNALGELSFSLTSGYVSGKDRNVNTDGTVINMIQTDAAINSGNSGGPLFNARGEVIGITTAKYSGTTSSGASIEGIGFAIPIDDVIGMLEDLRDYGYITGAAMGVSVRNVDADAANMYGIPVGVYVEDVVAGGAAQAAGIRAKDIIVDLGGHEIETVNDLTRALRRFAAGQTATVTVWRGGQEVLLSITFQEKNHS